MRTSEGRDNPVIFLKAIEASRWRYDRLFEHTNFVPLTALVTVVPLEIRPIAYVCSFDFLFDSNDLIVSFRYFFS